MNLGLLFCLTFGSLTATSALGAGPADPLLKLVPADAGLTFAVEDLRGQARAVFASPLYDGLLRLPAVQAWLASDRGRGYRKAKATIGAVLGSDFGAVRDGLLGEAFVLALRVPPGGRPEDARGLLLVRVPDRTLLDRAVASLNDAQLKKGELTRVVPRAHDRAGYFAREFRAPRRPAEFYAHLPDRTFAWSNSEELILGVLDRGGRDADGLAGVPAFREVRRRLPERALLSVFVDPRYVERLMAAAPRPKEPGEARLHALIGRYVGAVRYAGAAAAWRGDGLVLHAEEVVDPSKLGPGLRRWAGTGDRDRADAPPLRAPADALAVASALVDVRSLFDGLEGLTPEADRVKFDNLMLTLKGLLLGLDPRAEVAPRLGPALAAFVGRPEGGRLPFALEAEVARGPEGEKAAAAVDNALRTLLAFYALDSKHGGGKLGVEIRGGVTALSPQTPLAFAAAEGRVVMGNTAGAVARALASRADPSAGAWFERLRAAYFPGAASFACADLAAIHDLAAPRRADLARRLAARQKRGEAETARDLDQALALIHLFDAAFLTSAVDPGFTAVHRTLGLVTLPTPRP